MPRLIVKWLPYFKAGTVAAKHAPNLVRYIATRDGVDHVTNANRTQPATAKQKEFIGRILRDYPDTQSIFEYEDYKRQPTVENASEFISQALERHLHDLDGKSYYVRYIAERPNAEKHGAHGLFTVAGAPVVLAQVQREVAAHTGNIWTPIISLRREDAVRLSYDSGRQWQALLRAQAADIATHMKIHPDNFRWYAAFHNAAHHPHVHMICWSTDPKEGFLTEQAAMKMKSGLARQIFRQDMQHVYEQQTDRRGRLGEQSRDTMREMCARLKTGTGCTPELEALLLQLSKRLANTGGKKVYGFLKPDVKTIVDRIVDELAKDARVASCYDAWYDLREEVLRTYHDKMSTRAPLSSQKEFKSIKNMVIAEVMSLGDSVFGERVAQQDEPSMMDAEPSPDWGVSPSEHDAPDFDAHSVDDTPAFNEIIGGDEPAGTMPHANWTIGYKRAHAYLFCSATEKPDFNKARELFTAEAQSGNVLAMHDLGRMHADGLGVEPDASSAHEWYAKALVGFLQVESGMAPGDRKATYLQYRIGKMYLTGLGTEQNHAEAAAWLRQAADAGHKYAQYALGSMYYRGHGLEQNYTKAFALYNRSAAQGNAYASYELGKMHRDGIGTQVNATAANRHFETAYRGFVAMEVESADDKLQYRIGQMLRDGVGVEAIADEAVYYFERSAELGNPHAQYALAKMFLTGGDEATIVAAVTLLQKSADGGNPAAQYALGKLYRDGQHVEKDTARAVDLFTRAAVQQNDYAAYALGKLYPAGADISKDVSAAVYWLRESAKLNNQFAQYALGKLYRDGTDVQKDIPAAIRWLIASAEQGNQFAQYALGKLYLAGEDAPKDIPAAIHRLTESAEQGNQFAQYQLGKLYIMGKDVERDRDMALRWFALAAEQGNEYARFFIDHIDEIGLHNPDLFMATTRLLRQLGRIFEQQQQQFGGQAAHIDRKRMRVLQEKKLAQGHARDDREPKQGSIH